MVITVEKVIFTLLLLSLACAVCWLFVMAFRGLPAIPKCRQCNKWDHSPENWKVHPTGHDDFAWFHDCEAHRRRRKP